MAPCSPTDAPDLLTAFLPPKAAGLAPGQRSLCPGSPRPEPRPVRPVQWREVRLSPGVEVGTCTCARPRTACAQQGGTPAFPDRERLTCLICMAPWASPHSPFPLPVRVGPGAVLTGQIRPERPALSSSRLLLRRESLSPWGMAAGSTRLPPFSPPPPPPAPRARPPPHAHPPITLLFSDQESGSRFPEKTHGLQMPILRWMDVWMPGWEDGQGGAPPAGPSHLSRTPGCPLCGPRGVCTEA